MNQDTKNLNKFISIFKSLMEMERAYIELEEFGASYSFSDYFNACLDLNDDLEKIVNLISSGIPDDPKLIEEQEEEEIRRAFAHKRKIRKFF